VRPGIIRFTAAEEKSLWGDLADVFHLICFFSGISGGQPPDSLIPLIEDLRAHHFDAIYLDGYRGGRVGFISPEFQQLMLEIWKVKYLEINRLGDVIRSTAGVYLDHFLNDGDSPDIPIPVYVGFLNQIRALALEQKPLRAKTPGRWLRAGSISLLIPRCCNESESWQVASSLGVRTLPPLMSECDCLLEEVCDNSVS
jgi:hypothetical protein